MLVSKEVWQLLIKWYGQDLQKGITLYVQNKKRVVQARADSDSVMRRR